MKREIPKDIVQKLRQVPEGSFADIDCLPGGQIKHTISPFKPGCKGISENWKISDTAEISFTRYICDGFDHRHQSHSNLLSVHHCRQGRIGWNMGENMCLYLGSGDVSAHMANSCVSSVVSLPLGYYEGISVLIDTDKLSQNPPRFLSEAGFSADLLLKKLFGAGELTHFSFTKQSEAVFDRLYTLPREVKFSYLKLKAAELLLYLYSAPEKSRSIRDGFYFEQIEQIKEIHRLITENFATRYTVEELSKRYRINTSTLKEMFKSVYGMPIATYMKRYRIYRAAGMLSEKNMSVADVSRAVGYESQSKFSTAFKDIIGVLPTEYRKISRN